MMGEREVIFKEKTTESRIQCLDGLKGVLCLLIFFHHFCLIFFPAIHYGEQAPSYLWGIDTWLSQSPISVFLNGNYMVALFCAISAVVISRSVMLSCDKDKVVGIITKRYLRLMLPLFPIACITFVFLRLGLFTNQAVAEMVQSPWAIQFYKEPISFSVFLKSLFVNTWFFDDATLSTSFWMLTKLFLGTFACILLAMIAWKYSKKAWILYLVAAIFFLDKSNLTLAFILGTLLAWMTIYKPKIFNKYFGAIALIIGLFLGAYPSGVVATNFYKYLNFMGYIDWHIIAAILTLYGVFACNIIKKIFTWRPFLWLGKISYAVYLLHIFLLFSFTTLIFIWVYPFCGYGISVLLSFIVSLAVLLIVSFFYNKYIEKACNKLNAKILKALED